MEFADGRPGKGAQNEHLSSSNENLAPVIAAEGIAKDANVSERTARRAIKEAKTTGVPRSRGVNLALCPGGSLSQRWRSSGWNSPQWGIRGKRLKMSRLPRPASPGRKSWSRPACRKRQPRASCWPNFTDEEFGGLRESIRADGQIDAIKATPDKVIFDGWHRLRACEALGIEPVVKLEDLTDLEIAGRVNGNHGGRRNLKLKQIALHKVQTLRACGMEFAEKGDRREPEQSNKDCYSAPSDAKPARSLLLKASQKTRISQNGHPPRHQGAKTTGVPRSRVVKLTTLPPLMKKTVQRERYRTWSLSGSDQQITAQGVMDDTNVSKPTADGEITPGKRVIDEWLRLRACAEIGISPVTMIACFYEEEIAKKVIGAHRGRRHRTKIDMARLTVATMEACGMERRDGPRRPPEKFGQVGPISERAEEADHEASIPEAITPEAVARDANVSERTARRAIGEAKQRNQDATEE